ncbi:hypothetical protein HU200_055535 [Digitaria exilis]|uniref:Uncharacterized protein n=1 Tax=Digitaria exilis TaxID=1010633 RepID=A0A835AMH1_9POAL|nr:hypothetical protein HU200_055535 [Digitaria exilis]
MSKQAEQLKHRKCPERYLRPVRLAAGGRLTASLCSQPNRAIDPRTSSILPWPLGSVAKLLGPHAVVGSLGSLYRSVDNMEHSSYALPSIDKDVLLRPAVPWTAAGLLGSLLGVPDASAQPRCPSCGGCTGGAIMARSYSSPTGGFVQGNVMYTVMDDLTITSMSTISVLKTVAVRDLSAVQEWTVPIGRTEALRILKASIESKSVLTDVFVGRRAPAPPGMLAR